MKLSAKDVILITFAVLLGGPGTARTVLNLAGRYIEKRLDKYFQGDLNENKFRVVIHRLKKDGLLASAGRGIWKTTKEGNKMANLIGRRMSYEEFKAERKKVNTIVIFDIPELQRKKRDYLRIELLALGFKPLQKSVWIGGRPLPVVFIEYLKDMRLLDCIHIFTIKEFGTI